MLLQTIIYFLFDQIYSFKRNTVSYVETILNFKVCFKVYKALILNFIYGRFQASTNE